MNLPKEIYYQRCAVDILQHKELQRILKVFHEHRVDVLLLKGAFLKNHVYENPVLRPMGDIDVLIRKKDRESAFALLFAMDYSDINEGRFFAEEERGVVELVRRDVHFTYLLDLHLELVNLPGLRAAMNIPVDFAWEDAREIFIDRIPCYAMSPEVLLLYLCYHETVHHSLQGTTWDSDSREILRRYADVFSWERFLFLSSRFGMQKAAWLALKEAGMGTAAVPALEKNMSGYEAFLLEKILKRGKDVPFGDYVLAVCLINGTKNKFVFLWQYLASWMRHGARKKGLLAGIFHVVSRFFRLGRAVIELTFGRIKAA